MTNYLSDICYSSALLTILVTILVSTCQASDQVTKDLIPAHAGIKSRPMFVAKDPSYLDLRAPRRTSARILPYQGFLTPGEFSTLAGVEGNFRNKPVQCVKSDSFLKCDAQADWDRTTCHQDVDRNIRSPNKKILRKQRKKQRLRQTPVNKHVRFAEVINNRIERIDIDISRLQKRLNKVTEKKKRVNLSFPINRRNLLILQCESQVYGTIFPKVFVPAREFIKFF